MDLRVSAFMIACSDISRQVTKIVRETNDIPSGLISRYVKNRSSYRLKSPTMKLARTLQRDSARDTLVFVNCRSLANHNRTLWDTGGSLDPRRVLHQGRS